MANSHLTPPKAESEDGTSPKPTVPKRTLRKYQKDWTIELLEREQEQDDLSKKKAKLDDSIEDCRGEYDARRLIYDATVESNSIERNYERNYLAQVIAIQDLIDVTSKLESLTADKEELDQIVAQKSQHIQGIKIRLEEIGQQVKERDQSVAPNPVLPQPYPEDEPEDETKPEIIQKRNLRREQIAIITKLVDQEQVLEDLKEKKAKLDDSVEKSRKFYEDGRANNSQIGHGYELNQLYTRRIKLIELADAKFKLRSLTVDKEELDQLVVRKSEDIQGIKIRLEEIDQQIKELDQPVAPIPLRGGRRRSPMRNSQPSNSGWSGRPLMLRFNRAEI